MTMFGEYLFKKSIKKAEVYRKSGISASRLSELALNDSTKLRADELFLVALAIDVEQRELLDVVCRHLTIMKQY